MDAPKLVSRRWRELLTVAGLLTTLIGSGLGAYGSWVSPHEAVEIAVPRFGGETEVDNLKLPGAQALLSQSRFSKWGFVVIGLGTMMQLGALARR